MLIVGYSTLIPVTPSTSAVLDRQSAPGCGATISTVPVAANTSGPGFTLVAGIQGSDLGHSTAVSKADIVLADLTYDHNRGCVTVLSPVNGGWTVSATLRAPAGLARGADFGSSVAVSDNTMVVGASPVTLPGYNDGSGRAFVYERSAQGWSRVAELTGPGQGHLYGFGDDVAISGTTVVVSNFPLGAHPESVDKLFVFTKSPSGAWPLTATLQSGMGTCALAAAKNLIVEGDCFDSNKGEIRTFAKGEVRTFVMASHKWVSGPTIWPPAASGPQFGYDLALSGQNLIVSGWGKADIFRRSSTRWRELTSFPVTQTDNNRPAFPSVAISGSDAIVGAWAITPSASTSAVYYLGDTAGSWAKTAEISSQGKGSGFVGSVALGSNFVVVNDGANDNYIYSLPLSG